MTEKDDPLKADALRALPKLTEFLTIPHGLPKDTPEIVDTQGDLSNNAVALMLMFHRTLDDRFKMMERGITKDEAEAKSKEQITKGGVIGNFANRISLLTWAQHRKSREEAVLFGRGMKEDKPRLTIESLENLDLKPPDDQPRKRRLSL